MILDELGINLKRIDSRDQYDLVADTTARSKLILNELYNVDHGSFNGSPTGFGRFASDNFSTATLDPTCGWPPTWP